VLKGQQRPNSNDWGEKAFLRKAVAGEEAASREPGKFVMRILIVERSAGDNSDAA